MNFVAGVMILARLPIKFTSKWLDLESEGTVVEYGDQNAYADSSNTDMYFDIHSTECAEIEYDVFSLMRLLLAKDGKLAMTGLWQSGVPKMKLRVFQVDRILRWTLPKLHSHFTNIQLAPEVMVAQWFITLFSYTMSIQRTMRIWDYIFLEGWPGIFKVVFSLLKILEPRMLAADLEGVISHILCY